MDHVTFPERFHLATAFFDAEFGASDTAPLDDVKKLAFYALRRQATDGPCTESAPSLWRVVDRYKHTAWKELGNMNRFEAMVFYVQQLDEIRPTWLTSHAPSARGASVEQPPASPSASGSRGSDVSSEHPPPSHAALPPPDFDDVSVSTAVTPENVAALAEEVLRLRRLLADHGIPSGPTPGPSLGPGPSPSRGERPDPAPIATPNPPSVQAVASAASEGVYYAPARRVGWLEWLGLSDSAVPANARV